MQIPGTLQHHAPNMVWLYAELLYPFVFVIVVAVVETVVVGAFIYFWRRVRRSILRPADPPRSLTSFFHLSGNCYKLKALLASRNPPQCIWVHGECGAGKTSLVRAVCEDSELLDTYEASEWLSASQVDAFLHELTRPKANRPKRKLFVLDNVGQYDILKCDVLNLLKEQVGWHGVVIITSCEGAPGGDCACGLVRPLRIRHTKADLKAIFAHFAPHGTDVIDEHQRATVAVDRQRATAEVIKHVASPHELRVVGCALREGYSSWSALLSDLSDIQEVAHELSTSSTYQELRESLWIELAVLRQRRLMPDRLGWDVLLRVICFFPSGQPLPMVALKVVWKAFVLREGRRQRTIWKALRVVLCSHHFTLLLRGLVNARIIQILGDYGCVRIQRTAQQSFSQHPIYGPLRVPDCERAEPAGAVASQSLMIQALACICFYGNEKAQARLRLQTMLGHAEPDSSWFDRFRARNVFSVDIAEVLQHYPGEQSLVQQLLCSAATGCLPEESVLYRLHVLLGNAGTAPLALAVIVGTHTLCLPQDIRWCWMHSLELIIDEQRRDTVTIKDRACALAAGKHLHLIWKVAFLELGKYELAHRAIQSVVELYSRHGDVQQQLQAQRCLVATWAWRPGIGEGSHILQELQDTVFAVEPCVAGYMQRGEHQKAHLLEYECCSALVVVSEGYLGMRNYDIAGQKAEQAVRRSIKNAEVLGNCAQALVDKARRIRAWSLFHQGQQSAALSCFRDLYKMSIQGVTRRPEHYLTALAQAELGVALDGIGKHDDALHIKQAALDKLIVVLGDDHPLYLNVKRSEAITLALLRRPSEALKVDQVVCSHFTKKGMQMDSLQSALDSAFDHHLLSAALEVNSKGFVSTEGVQAAVQQCGIRAYMRLECVREHGGLHPYMLPNAADAIEAIFNDRVAQLYPGFGDKLRSAAITPDITPNGFLREYSLQDPDAERGYGRHQQGVLWHEPPDLTYHGLIRLYKREVPLFPTVAVEFI